MSSPGAMHIVYLHQYYCPPGGWGNNRSYDFARAWAAAGHQVTVVTSVAMFPPVYDVRSKPVTNLQIGGAKVIVINVPYRQEMGLVARLWAFVRFWQSARQVLKEIQNADVVYASSTPPTVGELGRQYAKRLGIPYVFETVDVWPDVPIGMGIVRSALTATAAHGFVNRIYRDAHAIVVLSEGMRDQVLSHGVPDTKVHVAHNGSDIDAIHPTTQQPKPLVRLLYAGTVGLANHVETLLHAMQVLNAQGLASKFECVIAGSGSRLEVVKQLAEQLKLPNVIFLPPVPKAEVNALLNSADVGVSTFLPIPVLEANSANKFFDYLASGLPVVCNYQGWQAEYLEQYACGLASPQNQPGVFAGNLKRLILDAGLRQQMGAQARSLAVQAFDRNKMANKVLAILQDAVRDKVTPQ